ncbi:hypothetical protein [Sphingobium olei]|uniref:Uncharacterized protein n=1 Tax=Sphingobium olei TaxID=420955 RepID=A0ABW3P0L6_9SPHN
MTNSELRALFIESAEILDEIESLPVDDQGYRELPPGSLDRAREIVEIARQLRHAQDPEAKG